MTVRELEQIVLGYAPLEGAVKGDVNGLLYGDPEAEVAGIAVTWSPTVRVLQEAAADGLNFVLTHELLWFPAMPTAWYTTLPEAERPHNQARKRILDRFAMAVCRCHSNWDPVEEHGIADACARALGFGAPVHRSQYLRMYHIAPRTLAQLAQDAKIHLGAPGVRVVGDLARPVERVGIAYGGFGQNWQCLDQFLMQGADVVILGEAIDYTLRAAVDAGLAVIETSHMGTETPGMRAFANLLCQRFPDLPVKFVDAGYPWVSL